MNQVTLSGHLGKEPEMFYTQNGKACTKFSLAVDNEINGVKQEPSWFNVTCWGDTAEAVAGKIKKGNLVTVKGSIRVSKFKSKRLVDQMTAHGVPRNVAEEISIATWYEISAYSVLAPNIASVSSEDIPLLDLEEGHF
jgi:single-strand DNA-binding protein